MEWIKLTVHTTTAGADPVSDLLIDCGAEGTMVEDRADIPDPSKPSGYWEIIDPKLIESLPEDVQVHCWLKADESLRGILQAIRTALPSLKEGNRDVGPLTIDSESVSDEDWSEVWKQYYKPFRAGKRLVVKPNWEEWDAQPGDLIIRMDPGMAFGSGTHETTGLCLELLEEAVHGGRVIDVGCGSGILAIGAALLGAEQVLAIDIDPDAVRVARENVENNGLADRIDVVHGNLLDSTDAVCDVCVANIIADVIIGFAKPLCAHIVPGGVFICSGIIREREEDVLLALTAAGYQVEEVRRRGEWVAIRSRRPA
ncbi:MAG: 50S ribosomal protein L11 methyltransferase [Clostridia bacterium]|nr:50S ribosomal protein L11 methyltransferase [Clostridia bacterium]